MEALTRCCRVPFDVPLNEATPISSSRQGETAAACNTSAEGRAATVSALLIPGEVQGACSDVVVHLCAVVVELETFCSMARRRVWVREQGRRLRFNIGGTRARGLGVLHPKN